MLMTIKNVLTSLVFATVNVWPLLISVRVLLTAPTLVLLLRFTSAVRVIVVRVSAVRVSGVRVSGV